MLYGRFGQAQLGVLPSGEYRAQCTSVRADGEKQKAAATPVFLEPVWEILLHFFGGAIPDEQVHVTGQRCVEEVPGWGNFELKTGV